MVHAVAEAPTGPWQRQPGVTLHVWAHCPNAAATPNGAILLPRLWCSPRKYPPGVPGSCKAGVRRCLADGECCRGGASPCGFRLHEDAPTNCTSRPHRRQQRAEVGIESVAASSTAGPEAQSFVSLPVAWDPYGEFTVNATFPIVGWGGFPGKEKDGFYGIVAPWTASNGTTWLFNEGGGGVLVRAPCFNCTYELVCADCLPAGWGEDPMLWLDARDHLHLVYHKFAGTDFGGQPCTATGGCGGHAFSADGGRTWHVGPTA